MPRNKRKYTRHTLRERIELAINKLPKYARNVIGNEKYLVNAIEQAYKKGLARDPRTGRKIGVRRLLGEYIRSPIRHSSVTTLRQIYSRFRNEEPSVYSVYNSYLYRRGLSSANYFYDNATYAVHGSVIEVSVTLPRGKYSLLQIEFDYSEGLDFFANMS